jgi:light-independent protochlorophyllide reductase subunit B
MFREDFEFHDGAGPSHHGGHAPKPAEETESQAVGVAPEPVIPVVQTDGSVVWLPDAERELKKIPFFVRGKAKRNTEAYAAERGVARISVETLYEAKAHYAR